MYAIRSYYDIGRTFIEPTQEMRDLKVKMKLSPINDLIRGKRLIVIDDSIVRGTTSRQIVRMLKAAGAAEVHMRISSPPTTDPCYYGVDTPDKEKLIAANMSNEEICAFIVITSYSIHYTKLYDDFFEYKDFVVLKSEYGESAPLRVKVSTTVKKGTLFTTFHHAKSRINFLFGDEYDEP